MTDSPRETWFRSWRYGFIQLWAWPVHWKGWVATAVQGVIVVALVGLLFSNRVDSSTLFFIAAVPSLAFAWFVLVHTDVVDLRYKRPKSPDNVFPGAR